jgi:predicted CXXCH cytochrome family protein
MHESARHGGTWLRAGSLWVGSGLVGVFLLLASCDEVESHKMLTFFFDGVPPLRGETSGAPSSVAQNNKMVANAPAVAWSVHEPVKDCTQCHGSRAQRGFSGKVQLVAEVPQLCYGCHKEFSRLDGWVHGPVATGTCLLCHEPHKTKTEALLCKPVPDLCYQCHDTQAVRAVKGHTEPSYTHCIDCHEGHAGATRNLLRPSFLEKPEGLEYQSEIYRRKYDAALRRARSELAQGQDFLALSRTVLDHIEAGQWGPARAYLEVLLSSRLVTEAEKPVLSDVLQQIVAQQTSKPSEPPDGTEGAAVPEAQGQAPAAALAALRDQRSERERGMAEIYYRSIKQYHAGQLAEAREGFRQVLEAGALPRPMKETVQTYLERIDQTLVRPGDPGWRMVQ